MTPWYSSASRTTATPTRKPLQPKSLLIAYRCTIRDGSHPASACESMERIEVKGAEGRGLKMPAR